MIKKRQNVDRLYLKSYITVLIYFDGAEIKDTTTTNSCCSQIELYCIMMMNIFQSLGKTNYSQKTIKTICLHNNLTQEAYQKITTKSKSFKVNEFFTRYLKLN